MSKQVDIVTVSRGISAQTQMAVREELKAYLDKGYELFDSHYAGIVGPELMMIYVLVKYEDEIVPQMAIIAGDAPRKRGRPAKKIVTDLGNGFGEVSESEEPS